MAVIARPIRPDEIDDVKCKTIPARVFEAFNELITQNFDNGSATVMQDKVIALMVRKGLSRNKIFDNGWLNIEGAYRKAGWKVKYDKPGFSESYEASFEFIPKRSPIKDS